MYQQRLKIFVGLCLLALTGALTRLAYLQAVGADSARQAVEALRLNPPKLLPTIRGKILDRDGRILAQDLPNFWLCVSYQLTRYADANWQEGQIRRLMAAVSLTRSDAEAKLAAQFADWQQMLMHTIDAASQLSGVPIDEIQSRIEAINQRIWELGRFVWWKRRNPAGDFQTYQRQRDQIDPAVIVRMDLQEMRQFYPLVELDSRQLLEAQRVIDQLEGVVIRPEKRRYYPYGSAACQLIGWVASARPEQLPQLTDDEFVRYLEGETAGKDGIEQAFEPLLRGRRGQVVYDKDGKEISRIEPEFGADVPLTLDIDLQQAIEQMFSDPQQNPNADRSCAAVVLDGATGDILAAVSTPVFDLNRVRQEYSRLAADRAAPLVHKALERNYPPGSTVKPLILAIGLEDKKVLPDEIISCPYQPPPSGWPRCLMQRMGYCHDARWEGEGGNNAVNAMRGSCNIYFSHVAHRLKSRTLQAGLFMFGYGQAVLKLQLPEWFVWRYPEWSDWPCQLRQAHGNLVDRLQLAPAASLSDVPPLRNEWERRFWGIGQGNLRVTVLQAGAALAALARGGVYKPPRLVLDSADPFNERSQRLLALSATTIQTVKKGMWAVVNRDGGSAYRVFHQPKSELFEQGITIYGKTGSTERPEHAWFECFAEDTAGRLIVVVVLVEGGNRGADDAAPLGHSILRLCSQRGYLGARKGF